MGVSALLLCLCLTFFVHEWARVPPVVGWARGLPPVPVLLASVPCTLALPAAHSPPPVPHPV